MPPFLQKYSSCSYDVYAVAFMFSDMLVWLFSGAGFGEVREALLRIGCQEPMNPGANGSFAFLGYTGPQNVTWVKRVVCPRSRGPAKLVELILTPAAEGSLAEAHAEEVSAEYEPVPVEEYDFDAGHGQSDNEDGSQSPRKKNARVGFRNFVCHSLPMESSSLCSKLRNI